jgi:F-type H+-transporting ATPase subunit c
MILQFLALSDTKIWGVAIICAIMGIISVMEGLIVINAINGMARNPEAAGNLRTSMIIGVSLVETVAIYTLVLAFLLIFQG